MTFVEWFACWSREMFWWTISGWYDTLLFTLYIIWKYQLVTSPYVARFTYGHNSRLATPLPWWSWIPTFWTYTYILDTITRQYIIHLELLLPCYHCIAPLSSSVAAANITLSRHCRTDYDVLWGDIDIICVMHGVYLPTAMFTNYYVYQLLYSPILFSSVLDTLLSSSVVLIRISRQMFTNSAIYAALDYYSQIRHIRWTLLLLTDLSFSAGHFTSLVEFPSPVSDAGHTPPKSCKDPPRTYGQRYSGSLPERLLYPVIYAEHGFHSRTILFQTVTSPLESRLGLSLTWFASILLHDQCLISLPLRNMGFWVHFTVWVNQLSYFVLQINQNALANCKPRPLDC